MDASESCRGDSLGLCARARAASVHVSFWLLAALVGFGAATVSSCVVPDPAYCSKNEECQGRPEASDGTMLVCHPAKHMCIPNKPGQCFKNEDCQNTKASRCDLTTNQCTSCVVGDPTDTSCGSLGLGSMTKCLATPSGPQCIECQQHLDCPSERPICDGGSCRACREHNDCEGTLNCEGGVTCTDSMVCIRDGDLPEGRAGSCAWNGPGSTGRVVYAHNGNTACSDTDPAFGFRFTEPVCNLARAFAIARDTGRRYIRILGSNYDPLNTTILFGSYSFIGAPGKNYPTLATMKGRALLFDIRDTARVTIDQLDMTEQNVDAGAIACSGPGSDRIPGLTIQRSILRGSTPPSFANPTSSAINVNDCAVRIEQSIIGVSKLTDAMMPSAATAHATAIRISDIWQSTKASYVLENNLIAGNTSMAVDLLNSDRLQQKLVMRFNTVAYNGRSNNGKVGGIRCATGPSVKPAISDNIIFGNSTVGASQIQFGEGCAFTDTVVGSADSCAEQGLRKNNPEFSDDFSLKDGPANRNCCLDQVSPASGDSFPSRDLILQSRPSGAKYDIGCYELQQ